MNIKRAFLIVLVSCCGASYSYGQEEDLTILDDWLTQTDANNALYQDLNRQAQLLLDERREAVDQIQSPEGWIARQQQIRNTLAAVLGPFPTRSPLNAQTTGIIERDRFTVEKVIYESQPGLHVTAALFLPKDITSKKPAILYCSGHTADGFRSPTYQTKIINLVLKGFVVLAFDPFGQGERHAYLDEAGVSRLGGATKQHSYPGAQLFMLGESMAKFMIWDGIRGIDYLLSRPEVDPARIGITGRSGGGTQTALIAAVDPRIAVSAPEAYITNYERLLSSIGPQDAEQNLFHGIKAGLNHADLLAVRAPKPTLMITTTRDFFSIQGARETFNEVQRVYRVHNAADSFEMVEDDAPHASTPANREAMYQFFIKHFDVDASAEEEQVQVFDAAELQATPTGQVLSSYQGESVFSLMERTAEEKLRTRDAGENVLELIRKTAGYRSVEDEVSSIFAGRYHRSGYFIDRYLVQGDGAFMTPLLVFSPHGGGASPTVIYLHPEGKATEAEPHEEIERLVLEGYTVIAPDLPGIGELGGGTFKGDAYIDGISLNTWFASILIGRSISGIQATEISRVAAFARTLDSVDEDRLFGVARGILSDPLLHAAAFDSAFSGVVLIESLLSYEQLVTKEYYAPQWMLAAVPGAVGGYDLSDLMGLIAPRSVAVVHPVDQLSQPASEEAIDEVVSKVRKSFPDRGVADVVDIISRERSWRLIDWLERFRNSCNTC